MQYSVTSNNVFILPQQVAGTALERGKCWRKPQVNLSVVCWTLLKERAGMLLLFGMR